MSGNGANVDLTVVSVVADTHDVSRFNGEHYIALGPIRCRATNSHETYEWTAPSTKAAPRIGDIVTVRLGDTT